MPVAPGWSELLWIYLILSLLTWCLYGWDKRASRAGWRRIPERRLHTLAVLGGWPGAWVAQRMFRHKTRKSGFRWRFLATIVVNLLGLAAAVYFLGLMPA